MIEWYTWLTFAVGIIGGVVGIVWALRRKPPTDLTAGLVAGVGVLVLVQIVLAIVLPLFGNVCEGDGLEFWMYLITAALIRRPRSSGRSSSATAGRTPCSASRRSPPP